MSFLEQLDNTREADKWPLVRDWMKNSPLEFLAELRESRPILKTADCTLLALHTDVVDALLQTDVFTVQLYEDKMPSYLMAQDDTPVHWREKSIMAAMLNRDDLPRIREFVGKKTAEFLDAAPDKQMDVVTGLTRAVPIALVQEYMGMDGAPPERLAHWSLMNQWNTFHNQPFDGNENASEIVAQTKAANDEFRVYIGGLVQKRVQELKSGAKRDDVLSRLLRTTFPEGVGFPIDRLVRNVGGMLIGTVETSSQATVQALQQLFQRPDALAQARTFLDRPEKFDGYVFEALRFNPISPYLFRRCASSYVMARRTPRETTIPAGTIVLPLVLSAMFDPAAHEAPNEFRPDRPPGKMFHFGFGLHECLGKYIGMVMIPEIIRQVLMRPKARPLSGMEYGPSTMPEKYMVGWA